MEQGLANELVGRAKGTLRKVANLATDPAAAGFVLCYASRVWRVDRAAADGGEKTRCALIASAGAARIEARGWLSA